MSYILDALRKSDQLRRRNAAPTLLLGQVPAAAPKQPALLSYGVLALVLLGAGIAIGWLRPWQTDKVVPAPMVGIAKPPEPSLSPRPTLPPDTAPLPAPELRPQNSAPATQAVPVPAPAQVSTPAAASVHPRATATVKGERQSDERQSAPPKAAAGVSTKAAAPVQEPALSSTRGATGAAPVPSVMTMAELPLAIQQELPAMSVSVHAYSGKPADRLVGINSRLLHEGENVAPGLVLEQITPDGMILSYKGYTFRRGVH
jgi:general secretion pathway protein B